MAPVWPRHHDGRAGRRGYLFGPILGVLSVVSLEEALKSASLVGDFVSSHWRLGTGATLVVAVLLSPDGLAGFLCGPAKGRRRPGTTAGRPSEAATPGHEARDEGSVATLRRPRAVDGVSVSFAPDLIHGIIGPNGAGKTTFTNLLSGALKPSAGDVLVDGQNVAGWPAHRIARRGIGRSFQRTNIFPTFTVEENCRLAAQAAHPTVLNLSERNRGRRMRWSRMRSALSASRIAPER